MRHVIGHGEANGHRAQRDRHRHAQGAQHDVVVGRVEQADKVISGEFSADRHRHLIKGKNTLTQQREQGADVDHAKP